MVPKIIAMAKREVGETNNWILRVRLKMPVNFVEAADMEKLTGKLLVDTYSKRSQTLLEKVFTKRMFCGLTFEVLTYIYIGERIGEIDRRICRSLHGEVCDRFHLRIIIILSWELRRLQTGKHCKQETS
jgi:hypothetical protein